MVVPINDRASGFDFDWEATIAAVNEACAGGDVACTANELCPECAVLKNSIKLRLIRAFAAGEASMIFRSSTLEDHHE